MSETVDYYAVLGVPRTATSDEIKRAYRALARTHHPDINKDPAAEAKFQKIAEANEVLSNPKLRAKYDAFGDDFRRVPDDADPREWRNAQQRRAGTRQPPPGWQSNVDDHSFEEFLQDLLNEQMRASRARGPIPGADQYTDMSLSLEDAFVGGRRTLTIGGPNGDRTIQVNIPAGVIDGQTIRLPGQGGRGTEGAQSGDLYLQITIDPHPRYLLSGRDIEVDLPLAPWEAVLGATVPVEGPGGTTKIKVAPGTSTGTRLRVRGRGMPSSKGNGDLYARVEIVVPEERTSEEERLYKELAEVSNFDARSRT